MDFGSIKLGDVVQSAHPLIWHQRYQARDEAKRRALGAKHFVSRAAAYMHAGEGYQVVKLGPGNRVSLRGFASPVSSRDLEPSDWKVCVRCYRCYPHKDGSWWCGEFVVCRSCVP